MVLVTLKWNKLTFEKIELDQAAPVAAFNEVVQRLTNVPADRQKLQAKGLWIGFLKGDANFSAMKISEGHVLTLTGTADEVVMAETPITFVEDMTEKEKAASGVVFPPGLKNLGNTCYLNSTMQCLRLMPELRQKISHISANHGEMPFLTKKLFDELDSKTSTITPMDFVFRGLRKNFPLFDQKGEGGGYMQQDAEEFFNVLTQSLDPFTKDGKPVLAIETEIKLSNQEAPQEAVSITRESKNKLVCMIQGSQTGEAINHMHEGIKLWMNGQIEKRSQILGRNALWQSTTRVSKLPKYICVQFMRFYWKETETAEGGVGGTKCKIMRDIKFPDTYNIFDICTEELQSVLQKNRVKASELKDAKSKSGDAAIASASASGGGNSMDVVAADADEDEDAKALRIALQMSVESMETESSSSSSSGGGAPANVFGVSGEQLSNIFDAGVPLDTTGNYELHSVVTHKGRIADGGHYMSYVRQKMDGSNKWWKFDDEIVTETDSDTVLKYSGGGDINTAYLLFYKIRD